MNFNLVSKNNLGAVTALLLVIILSQGKFFNFLLDTALGRAVLILFILFISYTNKILGIVCVLFIIIMFNNSDIGYMEGNTTMGSSMATTNNKPAHHTAPTHTAPTHTAPTHTALTPPALTPPDMKKKPVEGGAEGHNHLETERTGFNKKSGSIPATKSVGVENFEPFSGSYKEPYSQY
jgi:hypothetical protein